MDFYKEIIMRTFIFIFASLLLGACSSTPKETTPPQAPTAVEYTVDGTVHKGYIQAPATPGKKPAVIVVHEWWGHNDYARSRADQLAQQGYVALALDMYGEGKQAQHPKDAGTMSNAVTSNPELMTKKFQAALDVLKARPDVDTDKIAAIGYCFGGAVVLDMAKQGLPLKGAVLTHAMLQTPSKTKPGQTKAKILVLNGADDKFITAKNIADFKKEMKKGKVNYEFINYPGAKHAFSNPQATENGKKFGIPLEYNAEADKASWDKTLEFLSGVFK